MKNLLLFVLIVLTAAFCPAAVGVNIDDGMSYARPVADQEAGGGSLEINTEELGRKPFEPLYVYMGPKKLQEAIAAYTELLPRYDKEKSPREYTALRIRLGFCYLALQTARRGGLVRSANELFEEAVSVCGEKGLEREYYVAKIGRGLALTELVEGERVDNLRKAIEMLGEGAKFFTKETFPRAYAIANNGLGLAHVHLYNAAGKKDEDRSAAERYFAEVTAMTGYGKFPVEYAKAQTGKGMLYASLVDAGEEGLEDKILHVMWDARNIFSEEFFPTYYTGNLFLTGLVYIVKGDEEKAKKFLEKTVAVAARTDDPQLKRYMHYLYTYEIRENTH